MATPEPSRRRILDPTERFSEILFGLLMVLTFTGTLSAIEAGQTEVRTMLIGALSCNLAWGLVDAVMYVLASLETRGRGNLLLRKLQASSSLEDAHRMIAEVLPDRIAEAVRPEDLETLRRRLVALPPPPARTVVHREDLLGAASVFVLVFVSTIPVTIPFMIMSDAMRAMRWSNAIAIVMLFLLGHSLAKSTGGHPLRQGFGMLFLGAVLVAIIIALGG